VYALRPGLRKAAAMKDIVGIIVGLLLIGYLLAGIFKPERF
jgi:K+-transporting ATPase KdpF subunit